MSTDQMQALRDAADEAFDRNPGTAGAPADLVARIRGRLYPQHRQDAAKAA